MIFRPALCVIVFCLAMLVSTAAHAQENIRYTPSETRVAVLPVVDKSGEKYRERRERQIKGGYTTLTELFQQHGFSVADSDLVEKAVADQNLNLDDESEWHSDNLVKIGSATHANLVVFVVITETAEDRKNSVFTTEKQGRARIKIWLFDVKNNRAILNEEEKDGKATSRSKNASSFDEGTDRRASAVGNAIREALGEFFQSSKSKRRHAPAHLPVL